MTTETAVQEDPRGAEIVALVERANRAISDVTCDGDLVRELVEYLTDLWGTMSRDAGLLVNMLDAANGRVVELETELSAIERTAATDERRRLAELFESHADTFSEGLSVETLVFMLRLGTP